MFCAICTAESDSLVSWLDDGKLFRICQGCNDDQVVARRGPELAYDVPAGASQREIIASANRVMGARSRSLLSRGRGVNENLNDRTPGWILVRVPINGRDLREAMLTLRHRSWFRDLRILGSTSNGYHLFERPDPRLSKEQRSESRNPLAAIEEFRVEAP